MRKYSAYYPLIFLSISLIVVLVVRAKLNARLEQMKVDAKQIEVTTVPDSE